MKWFRDNWILICFLASIVTIVSVIATFIFAGIRFVDKTILQGVYSEYFNILSLGVSGLLLLYATCLFIKYARITYIVKCAERDEKESKKESAEKEKPVENQVNLITIKKRR